MNITNAQYIRDPLYDRIDIIKATINGEIMFVPTNSANSDYAEIMRQVEAGELTIAPADEEE